MTILTIHYDLVGSVPEVACFADQLDELILQYEQSAPAKTPNFSELTDAEREVWLKEALESPQANERITLGVVIELCAQHFYGLSGQDFDRISDLIDAMQGLEQTVKGK
jgi:hypothetical protein